MAGKKSLKSVMSQAKKKVFSLGNAFLEYWSSDKQ